MKSKLNRWAWLLAVFLVLVPFAGVALFQWWPPARELVTVQGATCAWDKITPCVWDVQGQPRDWAWLVGKYPGTTYRRYGGTQECVYRLRDVRETSGPSTLVVRVYNEAGQPVQGAVVGLYWQTASPRIVIPNDNTRWYDYVGAAQVTDVNGTTGFGLGGGSIYTENGAPHAVWVLSHLAGSDALGAFGWMPLTNHDGPLSLDFALTCAPLVTPTPAPTSTPGWVGYDLRVFGVTVGVELRAR